jgi:hypothetical protein
MPLLESINKAMRGSLLGEALNYTSPSNPEVSLFDFYALSWAFSSGLPDEGQAPGTDMMGRQTASFFGRSNIKDDIRAAFETLLPNLQRELLDATFISICAEMRHLSDRPQSALVNELTKEQVSFTRKLVRRVSSPGNMPRFERPPEEKGGSSPDYSAAVDAVRRTMKEMNWTDAAFVQYAGICYDKGSWSSSYGGRAWKGITDGWLRLNSAKNSRERAVAIDHVYDLQHNTGTVFNKVKRYAIGGGYGWLKKALDMKASVENVGTLLPKCSSQAKKIVRAAAYASGKPIPEPVPDKNLGAVTGTKGATAPAFTAAPALAAKSLVVVGNAEDGKDPWWKHDGEEEKTLAWVNSKLNNGSVQIVVHLPISGVTSGIVKPDVILTTVKLPVKAKLHDGTEVTIMDDSDVAHEGKVFITTEHADGKIDLSEVDVNSIDLSTGAQDNKSELTKATEAAVDYMRELYKAYPYSKASMSQQAWDDELAAFGFASSPNNLAVKVRQLAKKLFDEHEDAIEKAVGETIQNMMAVSSYTDVDFNDGYHEKLEYQLKNDVSFLRTASPVRIKVPTGEVLGMITTMTADAADVKIFSNTTGFDNFDPGKVVAFKKIAMESWQIKPDDLKIGDKVIVKSGSTIFGYGTNAHVEIEKDLKATVALTLVDPHTFDVASCVVYIPSLTKDSTYHLVSVAQIKKPGDNPKTDNSISKLKDIASIKAPVYYMVPGSPVTIKGEYTDGDEDGTEYGGKVDARGAIETVESDHVIVKMLSGKVGNDTINKGESMIFNLDSAVKFAPARSAWGTEGDWVIGDSVVIPEGTKVSDYPDGSFKFGLAPTATGKVLLTLVDDDFNVAQCVVHIPKSSDAGTPAVFMVPAYALEKASPTPDVSNLMGDDELAQVNKVTKMFAAYGHGNPTNPSKDNPFEIGDVAYAIADKKLALVVTVMGPYITLSNGNTLPAKSAMKPAIDGSELVKWGDKKSTKGFIYHYKDGKAHITTMRGEAAQVDLEKLTVV